MNTSTITERPIQTIDHRLLKFIWSDPISKFTDFIGKPWWKYLLCNAARALIIHWRAVQPAKLPQTLRAQRQENWQRSRLKPFHGVSHLKQCDCTKTDSETRWTIQQVSILHKSKTQSHKSCVITFAARHGGIKHCNYLYYIPLSWEGFSAFSAGTQSTTTDHLGVVKHKDITLRESFPLATKEPKLLHSGQANLYVFHPDIGDVGVPRSILSEPQAQYLPTLLLLWFTIRWRVSNGRCRWIHLSPWSGHSACFIFGPVYHFCDGHFILQPWNSKAWKVAGTHYHFITNCAGKNPLIKLSLVVSTLPKCRWKEHCDPHWCVTPNSFSDWVQGAFNTIQEKIQSLCHQ